MIVTLPRKPVQGSTRKDRVSYNNPLFFFFRVVRLWWIFSYILFYIRFSLIRFWFPQMNSHNIFSGKTLCMSFGPQVRLCPPMPSMGIQFLQWGDTEWLQTQICPWRDKKLGVRVAWTRGQSLCWGQLLAAAWGQASQWSAIQQLQPSSGNGNQSHLHHILRIAENELPCVDKTEMSFNRAWLPEAYWGALGVWEVNGLLTGE